jgi:DHA1 family bicyclomycin/chloramphenicol resistance-like MFS transporter
MSNRISIDNLTKKQEPSRLMLLLVLLGIISVGQFNTDIYLLAMPSIQQDIGLSQTEIQFTITFAIIAYGISIFIYGPLSDSFGRKWTIITGLLIFAVASLVCAFSENYISLSLGRFLQGLGAGCTGVAGRAIPRDIYDDHKLVDVLSYVALFLAITPAVAPFIGLQIYSYFGWKAIFFLLGGYSLFIAIIYKVFLGETNTTRSNRLTLKTLCQNYTFLLKDKSFLGNAITAGLSISGYFSYILISPYVIQHTLHYSANQNSFFIILPLICMAIGSRLSNALAKKTSIRFAIFTGGILAVCSSLLMFLLQAVLGLNLITFILPICVYMIGMPMIHVNANAAAMIPNKNISGYASPLLSCSSGKPACLAYH